MFDDGAVRVHHDSLTPSEFGFEKIVAVDDVLEGVVHRHRDGDFVIQPYCWYFLRIHHLFALIDNRRLLVDGLPI